MSQKLISFFNVASKKVCQLLPKIGPMANDLCSAQFCYLGEQHHSKKILSYQLQVLHTLTEWSSLYLAKSSKIAIVFEMFNMNQQELLNKYHANEITLKELQIQYDKTGREAFDIENHYGEILELAQQRAHLFDVFAGFPPRTMAKLFLNTDINDDSLWEQIFALLQLENDINTDEKQENETQNELMHALKDMVINGSEAHYQYFHYLLSDKVLPWDQIVRNQESGLFDAYGKIFVAQCFKDTVMAYNVMKLWNTEKYEKIVIIGGNGHFDCGYGVKERIEQLLQLQNEDLSQIKHVILSTQIEKEIKESIFMENVSDYILFMDDADV